MNYFLAINIHNGPSAAGGGCRPSPLLEEVPKYAICTTLAGLEPTTERGFIF